MSDSPEYKDSMKFRVRKKYDNYTVIISIDFNNKEAIKIIEQIYKYRDCRKHIYIFEDKVDEVLKQMACDVIDVQLEYGLKGINKHLGWSYECYEHLSQENGIYVNGANWFEWEPTNFSVIAN